MRTLRIKLYKFNELTKKAKQTAIEEYKQTADFDYLYDEAFETVKLFCQIFDIDMRDFDFQETYRSKYQFDLNEDILKLSGQRLATYIWNNYRSKIYKGKYYGRLVNTFKDGHIIPVSKEHPIGKRHVKRYSKVFMSTDCVLTGVCWDDAILRPIYDFINKPNNRTDFSDLLESCLSEICKDVQDEIKSRYKDDFLIDEIQANEIEFTADGKLY